MTSSRYDELRKRLIGPVYPILPAFHEDFSLDLQSVTGYVEYLNSFNVRALMLTAGTSRFNLLSNEEISQLNRTLVEANKGQSVSIIASPMTGSTSTAVKFAREAETIGADVLLIYYPERYYCDDYVYDYFKEISQNTTIGLMIHAYPMRHALDGQAYYSVDLCKRLIELGNVVGMKEEHLDPGHRFQLGAYVGKQFNLCVAGGGMRTFMASFLFHIPSYLVSVGSFKPDIEEKFYTAMMKKKFEKALNIVMNYEEPLFNAANHMGWHVAMKGVLSLLGLMSPHERPPLRSPDQHQWKVLKEVLTGFGWI